MLSPKDLRRPLMPGWQLIAGVDTGTYMSASFWLFPPDTFDAFCVQEFANYRYVGGEIELLGYSVPEWSRAVLDEYHRYVPGVSKLRAWADQNSQFKTELLHYGLVLMSNLRKLELRVEISREYVNNRRAHLAPWLSVLPYEMENARWPDEATSAGKFERIKQDDHTLDTMEHVLSRRPRHKSMVKEKNESFIDRFLRQNKSPDLEPRTDTHLGRLA